MYVGNIPRGVTEEMMMAFFHYEMSMYGMLLNPDNPILAVQINLENNSTFLEFRSVEDCCDCDMGKKLKRHKFIPSLTYVQNFVGKLRAVSEIWPGQISREERKKKKNNDKNNSLPL